MPKPVVVLEAGFFEACFFGPKKDGRSLPLPTGLFPGLFSSPLICPSFDRLLVLGVDGTK